MEHRARASPTLGARGRAATLGTENLETSTSLLCRGSRTKRICRRRSTLLFRQERFQEGLIVPFRGGRKLALFGAACAYERELLQRPSSFSGGAEGFRQSFPHERGHGSALLVSGPAQRGIRLFVDLDLCSFHLRS